MQQRRLNSVNLTAACLIFKVHFEIIDLRRLFYKITGFRHCNNVKGGYREMRRYAKNTVFTALCLAIGIIMPVYFHIMAPGIGSVFLPLHIPVLLCGLLCGAGCGGIAGFILPLLSSILTGMPPLYPVGAAMMLELCTYGVVSGLLHKKYNVYVSLIGAMLAGRIVSGAANAVLLGFAGKSYSFEAFVLSSFVTALPGIAIQIVLIPVVVKILERAKIMTR